MSPQFSTLPFLSHQFPTPYSKFQLSHQTRTTKFKKLRFAVEEDLMICFPDKAAIFCDSSPNLRLWFFLQLKAPFSPQFSMRRSARSFCSVRFFQRALLYR